MSMRRCLVVGLLAAGCAAWESPSSSSNGIPPDERVQPSHYAPPPPPGPGSGTSTPPRADEVRVTIASVRLSEDCPERQARRSESAEAKRVASEAERDDSDRSWCVQSTVQIVVDSAVGGRFTVEAARVLGAKGQGLAGTTRLRTPTAWRPGDSQYVPWDEQVTAGQLVRISYALAEPAWTPTAAQPFVLELDVSIDGRRLTVRSQEFSREPPDMVET